MIGRGPLAAVLMLLACTEGVETRVEAPVPPAPAKTPAAPTAPIRTDRTSYVFADGPRGREATILATFRAPADRAAYIVNCNGASGITVQRKVGETWEYAWLITMNACVSPPIVVPPGGEHTGRVNLHEQHGPKLESGTYRVVWTGVLEAFDANAPGFGGPELPLEQRISAPFTIEVPPRT